MRRNEKGFSLMELLVVIIIVAILAAVAVPLYINYVKDAHRSEARGAIGAIITAQQAYFQKNNGLTYAASIDVLKNPVNGALLDITEAEANWAFTTSGDANTFTVTATPKAGRPPDGVGPVTYTFVRTGTGAGATWTP